MMFKKIPYTLIIIVFLLIAIILQPFLLVNLDNVVLLKFTQILLHGGQYYYDFMEINPPLILFLYAPIVWLANILSMHAYGLLITSVFMISIFSLFACYSLLKKIAPTRAPMILSVLAFCFWLLPTNSFGEREHIMILLVMPYILSIVWYLQNGHLSYGKRFGAGVVAAIGFAIKPYFLIPWLLLTLWVWFQKRDIRTLFRMENFIIGIFCIIYLFFIFKITPEYITRVLPYVAHLYRLGSVDTLWTILTTKPMLWIFLAALLYLAELRLEKPSVLSQTFALAAMGFWLGYFLQHQFFYYHILPALTFLLLTLMTYHLKDKMHPLFLTLALMLFALIGTADFYNIAYIRYGKIIPQLQSVFNKTDRSNQNAYIFTSSCTLPALLFYYTSVNQINLRSPGPFVLPGLLNLSRQNKKEYLARKKAIINLSYEEFKALSPEWVFVDTNQDKPAFHGKNFHYLKFFLTDVRFKKIWQHYRYRTRMAEFEVYERINS